MCVHCKRTSSTSLCSISWSSSVRSIVPFMKHCRHHYLLPPRLCDLITIFFVSNPIWCTLSLHAKSVWGCQSRATPTGYILTVPFFLDRRCPRSFSVSICLALGFRTLIMHSFTFIVTYISINRLLPTPCERTSNAGVNHSFKSRKKIYQELYGGGGGECRKHLPIREPTSVVKRNFIFGLEVVGSTGSVWEDRSAWIHMVANWLQLVSLLRSYPLAR